MFIQNKTYIIFIILFLFCLTYLFAQPSNLTEKVHPMAKFDLSSENLLSSKTRGADSLNCTLVGGFFSGHCLTVDVVDSLAYIGAGQTMKILNVKDSTNPVLLGEVKLPDNPDSSNGISFFPDIRDINVHGTLAYVAYGLSGLRIINVADPSSPFEIGFFDTLSYTEKVWVRDTLVYVTDWDFTNWEGELRIVNVSDPTSPFEVGFYEGPDGSIVNDLWIQDTLAYTVGDSMRIINISDPTSPVEIGAYPLNMEGFAISVQDTLAYIGTDSLYIINVSDPTSPVEVGSYANWSNWSNHILDIVVQDSLAYLAISMKYLINSDSSVCIINVANPDSMREIGRYYTPGGPTELYLKNNLAYVSYMINRTGLRDGMVIIDINDPSAPFEIGRYGMGGFNKEVWVKDSLAYVANSSRGLRIINIADPSICREIGFFDPPGRDVEGVYIEDTLAYLLDADSGFRVIDITDPTSPFEIDFYNTATWLIDIWVKDTLAYIANSDSGLRIINVSNPSSMSEIGSCYTRGGAFDIYVQDTLAYVACDSGLSIINVSNSSSPVELGFFYNSLGDIWVQDTLAYLIDDDSLLIIDVSNPSSVSEVSSYYILWANNVWVENNLAYITCSDSVCLRILNVSDPFSLSEVGFYKNPYQRASGLYVRDSLIYVCQYNHGLYIYKYTGPDGGTEELTTEKVPFNISNISNTIDINYSVIEESEKVKIEIFNILGQKVACPVDGVKTRGNYRINWSGKTGIYFVRMEIGGEVYKQKALLLR